MLRGVSFSARTGSLTAAAILILSAAIGAYFMRIFAVRRLAFTFTDAQLTIEGALAVERLAYTAVATPLDGGPAATDSGKGLHVYALQPDRRWLLVQDIWNSDQPVDARR